MTDSLLINGNCIICEWSFVVHMRISFTLNTTLLVNWYQAGGIIIIKGQFTRDTSICDCAQQYFMVCMCRSIQLLNYIYHNKNYQAFVRVCGVHFSNY